MLLMPMWPFSSTSKSAPASAPSVPCPVQSSNSLPANRVSAPVRVSRAVTDQRDLAAEPGRGDGGGRARVPAADDDQVERPGLGRLVRQAGRLFPPRGQFLGLARRDERRVLAEDDRVAPALEPGQVVQ